MRLIYFDEVKDNDTNQEHFWMGGISLKAESVRSIEAKVTTISRRCFDDPHLKKINRISCRRYIPPEKGLQKLG